MSFAEALTVLFLLSVVVFELFRFLMGRSKVDAFFLFSLYFSVLYLFFPLCVLIFGGGNNPNFSKFDEYGISLGYLVSCLIVYLTISLFYFLFDYLWPNRAIAYYDVKFSSLLTFGVISCLLYLVLSGGLQFVLNNLHHIRKGTIDIGLMGLLFKKLMLMVLFAYLCAFYKAASSHSKYWIFLSVVTFFVAAFMAYVNGGRGSLAGIFFISTWLYFFSQGRIRLMHAVLGAAGFLLVIFKLGGGETSIGGMAGEFLSNFVYLHYGVENYILNGPYESRNLVDFPLSILFYFKLLGFDVQNTISYVNTFELIGREESFIPPGLVGFVLFNGWLGGAFVPMIYGFILAWSNSYFMRVSKSSSAFPLIFYFVHGLVFFMVSNSDWRAFWLKSAVLIVCLVVFVRKRRFSLGEG